MSDYQLVWRGIVHDSSGYGKAGREYVLALDAIGVDVKVEPLNFGTPPAAVSPETSRRVNDLANKPYAKGKPKVLLIHLQPTQYDPRIERNKYQKVICAAAWETTRVPDSWLAYANHYDAIIGFSNQTLQAFRDSGITVPLFRVPHGATPQPEPAAKLPPVPGFENHFKFLSVFRWDHRKAPEVLLRAFWEEFSAEDKVALIVKTQPGDACRLVDRLALRDRIADVKRAMGFGRNRAPVLVNVDSLSEKQMSDLYRSADVFVLPTRGEGAGLPFLEALSHGLPCVATGWGGQTDFLNDSNGWLIESDLECCTNSIASALGYVWTQLFTSEMRWAEPRPDHLRRLMRRAASGRSEVAEKRESALAAARANTWEAAAAAIESCVDRVTKM